MTRSAPSYWTIRDIAHVFDLHPDHIRKHLLAEWEAKGFPCPLPWSRRQRRYDPDAVLNWKHRQERAAGARLS